MVSKEFEFVGRNLAVELADLINAEIEYFRPMLERSEKSTREDRARWREETIRQRQKRVSLEVFALLNGMVQYGPFKGLRLIEDPWWGHLDLGSQCLGLYEKEILNFIENIQPGQFSTFLDIGAADGYYAVGILFSGKIKQSICFERTDKGRKAIQKNWIANGSKGRLRVEGIANRTTLSSLTDYDLEKALILIDIEGDEFELLDYDVLYMLRRSTILLEIHNWVVGFEEKYKKLLSNLDRLFSIEIIERVDRQVEKFNELRDFTDDNRLLLVSERRPCLMRFLQLTPKIKTRDFD